MDDGDWGGYDTRHVGTSTNLCQNGGYANIEFRLGYAKELPVEDASIDVIISNCVINLTEDKARIFREAHRVLKINGRLEVNDTVFGGATLPIMRSTDQGWGGCISGALPE